MKTTHDNPVCYVLRIGNENIALTPFLEKPLHLHYTGNIFCIQCGRKTDKSFQQGYCFPCYRRLLECNLCIIHPERCQVEQHLCPEDDWAHEQCHGAHIVYLANSSGLKVGITRWQNQPSRWMDQGAAQALPIFKTENRYQAGLIEVALKAYVADKTNWRNLLKQNAEPLNLIKERDRLLQEAKEPLLSVQERYPEEIAVLNESVKDFRYPVLQYPEKITSLSFDKQPAVGGNLLGIKGQYLIFDSGVINIRKFSGYEIVV